MDTKEILNRLAAVEAAVGITPNGSAPAIDIVADQRINKQALAKRWGTSDRSIRPPANRCGFPGCRDRSWPVLLVA